MRFTVFKEITFEVDDPVALIEAYCFQSDFYKNYDLLLLQGNRSIRDVNEIGARIKEATLPKCEAKLHKDLGIFDLSLDIFLGLDDKTRKDHVRELGEAVKELVAIKGIGFSKATKILHTLYPKIVPIIDNNLQKEYQQIKPQWKQGSWQQIFADYYDNFLMGNTYKNLCELQSNVSHLGLTRVRIFDILWWSHLKADKMKKEKNIHWTTIFEV